MAKTFRISAIFAISRKLYHFQPHRAQNSILLHICLHAASKAQKLPGPFILRRLNLINLPMYCTCKAKNIRIQYYANIPPVMNCFPTLDWRIEMKRANHIKKPSYTLPLYYIHWKIVWNRNWISISPTSEKHSVKIWTWSTCGVKWTQFFFLYALCYWSLLFALQSQEQIHEHYSTLFEKRAWCEISSSLSQSLSSLPKLVTLVCHFQHGQLFHWGSPRNKVLQKETKWEGKVSS